MRALKIIGTIAVLALALVLSYLYSCRGKTDPVHDDIVVTEYVRVYDTIYVEKPVPVDSVVVRYLTVSVPISGDSVTKTPESVQISDESVISDIIANNIPPDSDSVHICIPITQKHYADSTYEAWVSGYHPSLDSIRVFNRTEYVTTTIKQRPKRFGIGLQGGYGISPKGAQPYIGIGIIYNLWQF